MFGIDGGELLLIVVLAVLLLGPEKLPEYSRKAARIFVYLRGVANNTQASLREQLGPEYADLELADLNPKTFVKKHLSQEIAALEEAKREIEEMKHQLKAATDEAKGEVKNAKALSEREDSSLAEQDDPPAAAPFDEEAT